MAITIKSSIKVKEEWSLDFEEKNLKNIKKKLGFLGVKNEKIKMPKVDSNLNYISFY